jgi:hypothetical protein
MPVFTGPDTKLATFLNDEIMDVEWKGNVDQGGAFPVPV